jgi:hypothetical protein
MRLKQLVVAALAALTANVVLADAAVGLPVGTALPVEAGGLLTVAAACLAIGICIIHRKRNR